VREVHAVSGRPKKIVFGLIGAGRIGRLHAENLVRRVEGIRLKSIVDLRVEELSSWARSLGDVILASNPSILLDDSEVEAVVVCSSTHTHVDFITRCAKAGKHIFCEKPIGDDVSQIQQALRWVEECNVKLMMGFNRRFDRNFLRVRKAVRDGEIGEPHVVKITSRDPAPPPVDYVKVSGGLFFDMTIHDWDMARYLVGKNIEEVYATGAVLVDQAIGQAGDIDTAAAILRFEDGVLGIIDNSRQAVYGYDQRVEVFGSKGCVLVENERPNSARIMGSDSSRRDPILHFFLDRYTESYLEEMRVFVKCLMEDRAPSCDGRDGLEAVLVAKAAQRSYEERRPVRLDEVR